MTARSRAALPLLALGLALAALLSVCSGSSGVSAGSALRALFSGPSGTDADLASRVVWSLRLPRLLLAALAGASLASAGAALQALVRNPLAEAGLLGVSAGGSLGAAAVLLLFPVLAGASLVSATALGAAFAAALACGFVLFLARDREGGVSVTRLLLSGVALNALAGAGLGLMLTLTSDQQLRTLAFWMLGSLSRADWPSVAVLAGLALPCGLLLAVRARSLDALSLGEPGAAHLGVNVPRLKGELVAVAAILAGTVTALCGVIGFIGLVAPHLVRLTLGPSHRNLLPASSLAGALLLVLADLAARSLPGGLELPAGAVTALLGAPLFLWMLKRSRL